MPLVAGQLQLYGLSIPDVVLFEFMYAVCTQELVILARRVVNNYRSDLWEPAQNVQECSICQPQLQAVVRYSDSCCWILILDLHRFHRQILSLRQVDYGDVLQLDLFDVGPF